MVQAQGSLSQTGASNAVSLVCFGVKVFCACVSGVSTSLAIMLHGCYKLVTRAATYQVSDMPLLPDFQMLYIHILSLSLSAIHSPNIHSKVHHV